MTLQATLTAVLMVGHSLIGPDNPQMLQQLLSAGHSPETRVEAQIINGAPLSYNWEHGDGAQGVNARSRLAEGVDAVILAEAVPLTNHLRWSDTDTAVANYYTLAAEANPNVTVYVLEGWHSLLSGTGESVPFDEEAKTPWRTRLDQDQSRWQHLVDHAKKTTGGDIRLLPAGQALGLLSDTIQAGQIPEVGTISDFFADDIHPNALGYYYLSLVQYAVLTQTSPEGLPQQLSNKWGKAYKAPSAELAAALQRVAWQVVSGADGVITPPPPEVKLPEEPLVVSLNTADAPMTDASIAVLRQPVMMNLAPVRDWSPQAPFLDHFKTARPWIGHLPAQWGGATEDDLRTTGYLDEHGWPTAIPPELGSIGTVLLTDLPEQATSLSGRYVLRYDGDGIVEVGGRATQVRYGPGEVSFDFTPGRGSIDIRIQRSDADNYIRNITVVREADLEAYANGALFNPDWLDRIEGFAALRFMDWMATNNSTQVGWEDRPALTDYSWARKGVPFEVLIELANQVGADAWFTLPHMADDVYVRNAAQMVSQKLDEDLTAYVEYSNEVWNWQFAQARWVEEQARATWGGEGNWLQYYAGRAAQIAEIWYEEFSDALDDAALLDHRLIRVVSTQTGWLGLESAILDAPLWTASHGDRQAPYTYFDAYAVTGYFGAFLGMPEQAPMVRAWIADSLEQARASAKQKGLAGREAQDFVRAHRFDIATLQAQAELLDGLNSAQKEGTLDDLLTRQLPYHAQIAQEHGLDLIMYEGGTHVVGHGTTAKDEMLTAFFIHLNYSDEIAELYRALLNSWPSVGGQLFGAYSDVTRPGRWGSWGALRYLSDDNPRWDVLERAR